jgi:uncharacterized protein (UPF0262 family)
MKSMYKAFDRFMIVPVVSYSAATSGTAAKTVVLDMGDRKLQNESNVVIMIFLPGGILS